ncbi:hypothetical protein [Methanobrevibacter gottschalkii]|uniref:hypothetical protein n=1 Tax=Methanobrevibacter gottschalkii TaxID=190974 RepID=UPI0038D1724A
MKKILIFLLILIFALSINITFASNTTNSSDIYISNEGSDFCGDGSIDNPYQTLNYTIGKVSNNSNIYLKSGTYNSTGYDIVNKSISINGIGDVTIDGLNGFISQSIFKINSNASLFLNNIKFKNGYCDLDNETPSCIINQGRLFITNSTFDNFKTSVGVITNENYLCISNVKTSNLSNSQLFSAPYKYNIPIQFIYNIWCCDIYNSSIGASYNNKNMTLTNSFIERFVSNKDYSNQTSYAYFNNSNVHLITANDCDMLIFNNTYINCYFDVDDTTHTIEYSNLIWDNVTLSKYNDLFYFSLKIGYSNLTAISSYFLTSILFLSSNATISYSCILSNIITAVVSNVNVNYNWWGDNKGPNVMNGEFSKITSNYWVVMMADYDDSLVKIDLSKYTNGLDVWNLNNPSKLRTRLVKLRTETGNLTKTSGYLENATFYSELNGNNINTMLYAMVDNQVLRIVVGEGNSDYDLYISDTEGNDYFCDGSLENPYKTLKKVVSKAISGNKIYILPGYYTLSWNANIKILKNLTFIGIGNATLSRSNARNIFIVQEKGVLNIENLTFTQATSGYHNYYDPIIHVIDGDVNLKNSNFYNITTYGVVFSDKSEHVTVNNLTLLNVEGPVVVGNSTKVSIYNSKFFNGSEASFYDSYYSFLIPVCSNLSVVNCTVDGYKGGLIKLNPRYEQIAARSYIYNSTFLRNYQYNYVYAPMVSTYSYNYMTGFSIIENCTFCNNIGNLVFSNIINNCTFVSNKRIRYEETNIHYNVNYPKALIYAKIIINSNFNNNSFISKNYEDMVIHGDEVYYSTFINNSAAFGGALSGSKEIHYSIFINNSAAFGGNDVFVYNGDLNCSSNWWGSNQKPDSSRVFVFIGTLVLDDWVILTMDYKNDRVIAYLDNLLDNNGNSYPLNHVLPSRAVIFSTEGGELTPSNTFLVNNKASTFLIRLTSSDFNVFAQVDNQITSLTVYNNTTQILMSNVVIYGKDVLYNLSLININGHKISNQDLNVIITHKNSIIDSFIVTTDKSGDASFSVDYAIGIYQVNVVYLGNGYFEECNSSATINVSSIKTKLQSYNQTYSGKNNKFYAILVDYHGRYLLNRDLILRIFDLNDNLVNTVDVKTGVGGRADVLLSLDVGNYKMKWDYLGNEWYEKSTCISFVTIRPIETNIILPNTTLYGKGNDYEFTFKDMYGNLISNEMITFKISKENESSKFSLITKKGIASININLLPGKYDLEAVYAGDKVYGSSFASAILYVEPIFVTMNHNSYQSLPKNGVFTVILKDMYGTKVSGENLSLELINKDIHKVYEAVSDASGQANFKLDAPEGVYFALINYGGNIWYGSSVSAVTIEINSNVPINPVYINGSNLVQYYGEDKYYLIKFNDTNAYSLEGKLVNVLINSEDWSNSYTLESNVFGEARIQIALEPGTYNITYNYKNEYYGLFAQNSSTIFVYKMPTSLIASNMILKKGDSKNLEVKLVNKNGDPIANLPVIIKIDDNEYNITTNQKGIAKLLLNLDLGTHNVTYSFNNKNYISSKGNVTILVVNDSKKTTTLLGNDVYTREDQTINYTVLLSDLLDNPISSSEIVLKIINSDDINIKTYKGYTDVNGVATFKFNLKFGNYFVNAYYNGNSVNLPSFTTNNLYIKVLENYTETILFGNDIEIHNGGDDYYSVVLSTVDGEFIKNQIIEFIIKNNSYFTNTDENGIAYLKIPFSPGSYEVLTKFHGCDNLTSSSIHNYISIYGDLFNFYSKDVVKAYNNGTHYYVALYDTNNEPLSNKTINFYVNNQTYQDVTNADGFVCFEVWLNPGKYIINATFKGEYPDEFTSVVNNITVLPTIMGENLDVYYNENTVFSLFLLDYNCKPLENTEVVITIGGAKYSTISTFGSASWKLKLNAGVYNVICKNPITTEKITRKINIKSTIISKNLVKYYKGSSKFSVTFKDRFGNFSRNSKVKFIINKKTYVKTTNSRGIVSLNINLKPGKYTIKTYNLKTGEIKTNKITIKTLIISKNKKVKAGKKINYNVKVFNSKGKIAKKATIKFKIKGITYKIKTNKKGIAKLNIVLKKGKYTLKTSYFGLSVKNKITVK